MPHCKIKHRNPVDDTICAILSNYTRIAIVGLSSKPTRDSNRVGSYLLEQGYGIFPVNPQIDSALGLKAYPDLFSVPPPIEVVDIFRRVQYIPEIVDRALQVGARAIWMQSGLVEEASAQSARQAGLLVVMNRCMIFEHTMHFA
jgi:predicted CoA-binding protein